MDEVEYYRSLAAIRGRLTTTEQRQRFDAVFPSTLERSPVVTWGLGVFLGMFGVDRFRLGHWGRGLGKLACTILTIWAYGIAGMIWAIVDLFLVGSGTRLSNLERAEQLVADITGQPRPMPPLRY